MSIAIVLTWLISATLKCPSFKAADVDCRVQLTTLTFLIDEVSICTLRGGVQREMKLDFLDLIG